MSVYDKSFDLIIDRALNVLFSKKVDIYTFAFYYDHESYTLEVLADTKINSLKSVLISNKFAQSEFLKAIESKDLEKAIRLSRSGDRSLSLGDFKYRSLGWQAAKAPVNSAPFSLAMTKAVIRNREKISALSRSPADLLFLCSTQESEAGLIWRNFP